MRGGTCRPSWIVQARVMYLFPSHPMSGRDPHFLGWMGDFAGKVPPLPQCLCTGTFWRRRRDGGHPPGTKEHFSSYLPTLLSLTTTRGVAWCSFLLLLLLLKGTGQELPYHRGGWVEGYSSQTPYISGCFGDASFCDNSTRLWTPCELRGLWKPNFHHFIVPYDCDSDLALELDFTHSSRSHLQPGNHALQSSPS